MTDLRSKALSALRDGRVRVVEAKSTGTEPPTSVVALVASSREQSPHYVIDLRSGDWTCMSAWPCRQPCAHVAAVQLVTGHPSPAAKEATQ